MRRLNTAEVSHVAIGNAANFSGALGFPSGFAERLRAVPEWSELVVEIGDMGAPAARISPVGWRSWGNDAGAFLRGARRLGETVVGG